MERGTWGIGLRGSGRRVPNRGTELQSNVNVESVHRAEAGLEAGFL